MKVVQNLEIRTYIEEYLMEGQSPEAIAGRLKEVDTHLPFVSATCIRRYIKSPYGRVIESHRNKTAPRKKRKQERFLNDPKRTGIDKRPLEIQERTDSGHTEADFIVSGKDSVGRILVVVDLTSRYTFLEPLPKPTTASVHNAFAHIKERFPEMQTITTDNDIFFQKHEEIAQAIQVHLYFCKPYASWEKGSVENTNKHLRKHLPKGTDLAQCTSAQLTEIANKLNNRIMEVLHYRKPCEVLRQQREKRMK